MIRGTAEKVDTSYDVVNPTPAPQSATGQSRQTSDASGEVRTMNEISSPDFRRYSDPRSPGTVLATARMSAAQVDPSEVAALMSEHRTLAYKKMLEGGLSPREAVRLDYVRWSLDRIEDATSGPELDTLAAEIALYRQLGEDLKALKASVDAANARSRKGR